MTIRHELEIKSGELLEFKLGNHPSEGIISIKEQTQHHKISEIVFNLYRYQSVDGFKGRDLVKIERKEGRGDENFNIVTLIEIEILVN